MIENELKYVLKNEAMSQTVVQSYCGAPMLLRQGYLPGKARIRSKAKVGSKKAKFEFNYKLPVNEMLFEIEKEISAHDFDMLWPQTTRRLCKLRYVYVVGVVQWDIDFFLRDDSTVYFAMAEAEMPETMLVPDHIPPFLERIITYKVPRDRSKEFTSQKVSEEAYVETLVLG